LALNRVSVKNVLFNYYQNRYDTNEKKYNNILPAGSLLFFIAGCNIGGLQKICPGTSRNLPGTARSAG
jgi:hypothetical protein